MKCKEKALLISIVLYFFLAFGCIISKGLRTVQPEELSFGSSLETPYHDNQTLEPDEILLTVCRFSVPIDAGDALRHFVQTNRFYKSFPSKYGLTSIKKDFMLFTLHHISESCKKIFPGLTENRRYLISLRKLII